MAHVMRRKKQALSTTEILAIIEQGTSGTLAVYDEDGYPYAVPLSYLYDKDCLYFHCAREGHKIEAIKHHPKVSFCIIDQDEIIPEKFTTKYKSVILFGEAFLVEDESEKREALKGLAQKYSSAYMDKSEQEINQSFDHVSIIKVVIQSMSGKQGLEFLKEANFG